MRPVGPETRVNVPRQSNVGDGHEPTADIRVLKGRGPEPAGAKVGTHIEPGPLGDPARVKTPAGPEKSAAGARYSNADLVAAKPASYVLQPGAAMKAGGFASAVKELSVALRLPADLASCAALSALIGERLPLDARTAQAVRRVARLHDDDPAAARMAARALAAGLDPEGAAVRKVLGVLDAPDSGGAEGSFSGESSLGGSSTGEGGDRERRSGIKALPMETPEPSDDADEIQGLVTCLKTAARIAMDDPDLRALAAPNAGGAGWVCIPFDIPFAGINFHGFFRILYYGTTVPARKLIADIRFGDQRRLLELSGSGLDTVASYYADDELERLAFDTAFGGVGKESASSLVAGDFSELSARRSVDEDV